MLRSYGVIYDFDLPVMMLVQLQKQHQKKHLQPEISLIRDSDFILYKIIKHAPTHPHRTRRR